MRIILFGATGQLGTQLVARLGDDCIPVTRQTYDFATGSGQALAELVARHAPDMLVNAAAWAAVDDAEKHKEEVTRINATVPGWLAAIATRRNIPLIHFSTDYVFDGEEGAPYREDAKTGPVNHYGVSKLAGEKAILATGAAAYIFRLQLLYQAAGNSFFCRMLKRMSEKETLNVAADQLSAPTSVADVADAILSALPLIGDSALPVGIYHMAAQGYTSRHGFTLAIREEMLARGMKVAAKAIGPVVSEEFPSPAQRPKDVRLNTEKLASHGLTLPHWRTSLKQVMDEVHARR